MIRDKKFKISLVLVCFLMTILVCSLMFTSVAFADYEDIINDQNALVNFNQMVENSYINYVGASSITVVSNLNYDTNDKLYIRATNSGGEFIISFYNSNNEQLAYQGNGSVDLIVINNDYRNIIRTYTGSGVNITNFNIYNLTKTFGVGNEPSLEECHNLYISNSYAYNTGTVVSLSGLSSYAQGYNDAFKSVETIIDDTVFSYSVYPLGDTEIYTENVEYYHTIVLNDPSAPFVPTCGYNFNTTLSPGDIIDVSLDGIIVTFDSENGTPTSLELGYYEQGTFVPLNSILFSSMNLGSDSTSLGITTRGYNTGYVSFTLNTYINNLVFRVNNTNFATFVSLQIKVRSNNYLMAIQNAYDSGVARASQEYAVGGTKYNQIFNLGKTAGINENNPYTFSSLMFSVINAPVQAVLNIFNFEFLGFNLKNFITVLLTLCLILAVVNLFMGGK